MRNGYDFFFLFFRLEAVASHLEAPQNRRDIYKMSAGAGIDFTASTNGALVSNTSPGGESRMISPSKLVRLSSVGWDLWTRPHPLTGDEYQ